MKSCENCAHYTRSGDSYGWNTVPNSWSSIRYKNYFGEPVCAHPSNLQRANFHPRVVIPNWTPEELRAMPELQSKLLKTCGKDGRYYEPAIFRDGDLEDGQTPCTEASADKFANGQVPPTRKRPAYNTYCRLRAWFSKSREATRTRRAVVGNGLLWSCVLVGLYIIFLSISYYVNP